MEPPPSGMGSSTTPCLTGTSTNSPTRWPPTSLAIPLRIDAGQSDHRPVDPAGRCRSCHRIPGLLLVSRPTRALTSWDKHARNYDKQIAFSERRLFGRQPPVGLRPGQRRGAGGGIGVVVRHPRRAARNLVDVGRISLHFRSARRQAARDGAEQAGTPSDDRGCQPAVCARHGRDRDQGG